MPGAGDMCHRLVCYLNLFSTSSCTLPSYTEFKNSLILLFISYFIQNAYFISITFNALILSTGIRQPSPDFLFPNKILWAFNFSFVCIGAILADVESLHLAICSGNHSWQCSGNQKWCQRLNSDCPDHCPLGPFEHSCSLNWLLILSILYKKHAFT